LAPTVGIAATGFCYPGGIFQLFYRQDQQILRLPTAADRSHQITSSASASLFIVSKIFVNAEGCAGQIALAPYRHRCSDSVFDTDNINFGTHRVGKLGNLSSIRISSIVHKHRRRESCAVCVRNSKNQLGWMLSQRVLKKQQ
jgi:hypothetical protein